MTLTCNCNATYHVEDDAPCVPWADMGFDLTREVVIPCGGCVSAADLSGELVLPGGLDVQGQLRLDNVDPLVIKTPHLVNQGVLSVPSLNPEIAGTPRVEVVLTGSDGHLVVPHGDSAHACPAGGCDVSSRAVVTAGGRLDVRAWPDEACRTWTRIRSVGSTTGQADSYDTLTVDDPAKVRCWGVGGEPAGDDRAPVDPPFVTPSF